MPACDMVSQGPIVLLPRCLSTLVLVRTVYRRWVAFDRRLYHTTESAVRVVVGTVARWRTAHVCRCPRRRRHDGHGRVRSGGEREGMEAPTRVRFDPTASHRAPCEGRRRRRCATAVAVAVLAKRCGATGVRRPSHHSPRRPTSRSESPGPRDDQCPAASSGSARDAPAPLPSGWTTACVPFCQRHRRRQH